MTTAPGCMDDYDTNSLSVAEALRRIDSDVQPLTDTEAVPLCNCLGRILGEDIISPVNVPAHHNSAMDGYAIRGSDIPLSGARELQVVGTAWAGKAFPKPTHPGECVRIMTGAVVPEGTDTVIMQEHAVRHDDVIQINSNNKPGQHVRQAGEDLAIGQIVMQAGKRLLPAELGVLASLGIAKIKLVRCLRVAFFTTGDELCSLDEPLGAGNIYDSNRYTITGMLTRLGVEIIDLGIIKDEREAIRTAFIQAADTADAIITSGGVSVGEADFVKETLEHLGQVNFWKIAMKPGRPLAFGKINNSLFFGLPGNPVSVMATFYQFVQPALRRLMGQAPSPNLLVKVPCISRLKKAPGRMEFQRGILEANTNGELVVRSTGEQGSGILSSMSQANCFIVLPVTCGNVEPGGLVEVQLFEGLV
ncbi:MAG: molybdopterin molybdotransferase MoeA [Gammaproteobacteria bacterium]